LAAANTEAMLWCQLVQTYKAAPSLKEGRPGPGGQRKADQDPEDRERAEQDPEDRGRPTRTLRTEEGRPGPRGQRKVAPSLEDGRPEPGGWPPRAWRTAALTQRIAPRPPALPPPDWPPSPWRSSPSAVPCDAPFVSQLPTWSTPHFLYLRCYFRFDILCNTQNIIAYSKSNKDLYIL
jgi:hypothetical protein